MGNICVSVMESPIGYICIKSNGRELLKIDIKADLSDIYENPSDDDADVNKDIINQLSEYFNGERKSFDFRYNIDDYTEFQKAVYRELKKVPYGKTVSYGDLAERIGRPRAYRAVGNALNKNPLPIIIPCHRVISSDGSLGGFGGGTEMKKRLLSIENISVNEK